MTAPTNITACVGNTPLVELKRVTRDAPAKILAKLEFFNPLSSVKDRIGVSMIEDAQERGVLSPNTLLIEPTSGNTGIALAFVAAAKGLRLKLVMPDSYSQERQMLFRALGADLELTPGYQGMQGAVDRAHELAATLPDTLILQQFQNPANPAAHERTTGPELLAQTQGNLDAFVTGVGTGGTITGVTRFMRTHNPNFMAFAVEPSESPVIAGGAPGPHDIQGIGAGFIPDNLDTSLLSGIVHISTQDAIHMARRLAAEEGLLVGISSGANIAAAIKVANLPIMRGKTIATVCCSSGERYLSTALFQHLRAPNQDP